MPAKENSLPLLMCLTITLGVAIASISFSHDALAAASSHRPHHATTRVSKCLCGYGLSGYDTITCVPVKDCEWEHAVCRGSC
jgi:hypothetical protein